MIVWVECAVILMLTASNTYQHIDGMQGHTIYSSVNWSLSLINCGDIVGTLCSDTNTCLPANNTYHHIDGMQGHTIYASVNWSLSIINCGDIVGALCCDTNTPLPASNSHSLR